MAAKESSVPYGKRLLPSMVDENAEKAPEKLLAYIPRSGDLKDGFTSVTRGDFARAVNRCAWWLEGLLGTSTTFETLSYLGPSDLRYFILIIAVSKVGYKVSSIAFSTRSQTLIVKTKLFLPSPRNSVEAQVNLFNKTSCEVLITIPSNKVKEYLEQRPMRLLYVPELEKLLEQGEVPRYPFTKTFEEAKDNPLMVLHTSGSTGFPKPVSLPHSWVCGPDIQQTLEPYDGYELTYQNFKGARTFSCLPPFHVCKQPTLISNM
jgi:acyl-coenzyme A synthetase/AMP-(fatty) acid ligase